jgi:hypothetical protein
MRGALSAMFAAMLASALAGCTLSDLDYYRGGIGTELYVSSTLDATAIQDAYLGLICRQAGLVTVENADGSRSCGTGAFRSSDWSLLVQAGMNDIDRRCDSYLLWLDDKRRSNEPFLKELAAISAATLGIMDATSASVKAITITGIAFGLAANTFTNINSRLLALEQSTIQSLVIDSQQTYRLNNRPSLVDSRPAAIYYLRNYLRICLPFSIETSVNNTVTVLHRAGPAALMTDTIFTRSVIDKADAPIQRPSQFGPIHPEGITDFERRGLTPAKIIEIMAVVCPRPKSTSLADLRAAVNPTGITVIDAQRITNKFNGNGHKPIPCP